MKIRNVSESDAVLLQYLASSCKPLDVHTVYTYWVLCKWFSHLCYILEDDNNPVGFITAIENSDSVIVWQIGIVDNYIGKGFSSLLIDKVLSEANKSVYVTIDKRNISSTSVFRNYAKHHNYSFEFVYDISLVGMDTSENESVYKMTKGC